MRQDGRRAARAVGAVGDEAEPSPPLPSPLPLSSCPLQVGVPLRADWAKSAADWTLDLSELEAALSERTKLLVLNTPHNPTGKVFSAAELEGIAHIVRKYPRLVVMSDEVYEFMTFDGLPHARISALPGMFDRTLSIHSAGKTFSATGWRIGYVIGPAPLITPLVRVHQASNFCTPTSLQVATAVAFDAAERDGYFAEFANFLELKRNKLVALLRTAQLDPIVPQVGEREHAFPLGRERSLSLRRSSRPDRAAGRLLCSPTRPRSPCRPTTRGRRPRSPARGAPRLRRLPPAHRAAPPPPTRRRVVARSRPPPPHRARPRTLARAGGRHGAARVGVLFGGTPAHHRFARALLLLQGPSRARLYVVRRAL